MNINIKSPKEMQDFGCSLSKTCQSSANNEIVIYLSGNLGAGKTMLVSGFLKGFGHKGKTKSPTFTIVEPYQFDNKNIYHFDLYRLVDPNELEYIGIRDYFSNNSIVLIEWPERAIEYLNQADLVCKISFVPQKPKHRQLYLTANSEIGANIIMNYKW